MYEIIFNTATTERRAAVKKNGTVIELLIERPEIDRIAGSIYKGRVKDVIPGMEAAFIDIGRNKNGYLPRNEIIGYKNIREPDAQKTKRSISEFITEGQEIIVQVTKEEFGDKGARLTEDVTIPGAYTVYMPEGSYIGVSKRISDETVRERWRDKAKSMLMEDEGIIIRTICEHISEEQVEKDLQFLREDWIGVLKKAKEKRPPIQIYQGGGIIERLLRDYPIEKVDSILMDHLPDINFAKRFLRFKEEHIKKVKHYRGRENIFSREGLEKHLEKALQPKVWLKSGGFLIIEHTEAMTVIDVNTGRYTGKGSLEETMKKTNLEAAEEIARQLRLRDISGIVVIDFIDMKEEHNKNQIVHTLQKALSEDRTTTSVVGMSPIGLVEMTRKKVRRSLADTLFTSCRQCRGGFVLTDEALAYRAERMIHEYRDMEDEAIMLELPESAVKWLKNEGKQLLEMWKERYLFSIFLLAQQTAEIVDIRFIGSRMEAEARMEKWTQGEALEV